MTVMVYVPTTAPTAAVIVSVVVPPVDGFGLNEALMFGGTFVALNCTAPGYPPIRVMVIVLLAVGSDYNLLLVSRFKEEIHAGIKTGIIRSMAGTGAVVTSAGLVFAFTMMSMVVSDLVVAGQVGTTIGLGLLFDTLVIRSFMTPSVAAIMGPWFWWPQTVRMRPRPVPWPKPPQHAAQTPVTVGQSDEKPTGVTE